MPPVEIVQRRYSPYSSGGLSFARNLEPMADGTMGGGILSPHKKAEQILARAVEILNKYSEVKRETSQIKMEVAESSFPGYSRLLEKYDVGKKDRYEAVSTEYGRTEGGIILINYGKMKEDFPDDVAAQEACLTLTILHELEHNYWEFSDLPVTLRNGQNGIFDMAILNEGYTELYARTVMKKEFPEEFKQNKSVMYKNYQKVAEALLKVVSPKTVQNAFFSGKTALIFEELSKIDQNAAHRFFEALDKLAKDVDEERIDDKEVAGRCGELCEQLEWFKRKKEGKFGSDGMRPPDEAGGSVRRAGRRRDTQKTRLPSNSAYNLDMVVRLQQYFPDWNKTDLTRVLFAANLAHKLEHGINATEAQIEERVSWAAATCRHHLYFAIKDILDSVLRLTPDKPQELRKRLAELSRITGADLSLGSTHNIRTLVETVANSHVFETGVIPDFQTLNGRIAEAYKVTEAYLCTEPDERSVVMFVLAENAKKLQVERTEELNWLKENQTDTNVKYVLMKADGTMGKGFEIKKSAKDPYIENVEARSFMAFAENSVLAYFDSIGIASPTHGEVNALENLIKQELAREGVGLDDPNVVGDVIKEAARVMREEAYKGVMSMQPTTYADRIEDINYFMATNGTVEREEQVMAGFTFVEDLSQVYAFEGILFERDIGILILDDACRRVLIDQEVLFQPAFEGIGAYEGGGMEVQKQVQKRKVDF